MTQSSRVEDYLTDVRARQSRVWPAEVPKQVVYPQGERPITDHLVHWSQHCPDRVAINFYGRRISYAELEDLTARFCGWLQRAGVRPGDRVGVLLPNCPQFIIAMFGILRAGAVHVPVNPMFREHELRHELADAGVEVLVAADSLQPLVEAVRADTSLREVLLTRPGDMMPTRPSLPVPPGLLSTGPSSTGPSSTGPSSTGPSSTDPSSTEEAVDSVDAVEAADTVREAVGAWDHALGGARGRDHPADLDALAALNYTGGTTGLPKGCEHTQRHMLYTAATAAAAYGLDLTGEKPDVLLIYVPVFWIAGEDFGILLPVLTGGTMVLLTRWDPEAVLEAVGRCRVTLMLGTVDNYVELMEHPRFPDADLSSLVQPRAMSFVRKLTPRIRARWRALAGAHSVLREASYGMTETHTADSFTTGFQEADHDLLTEPVFCGLPVPGTDFMVVDETTGEPLPLGERGEIVVRSPSLLTGYWQQPEATARALRDGWLHTGDVGLIDEDGCLHYLGRNKEMIKVSGMSVFPSELEALLARHPDVLTAAVVPMDDSSKGQVPLAFVQPRPGVTLSPDALRAWARDNMAPYKVPVVVCVDALPMTTTGKVKKGELLERAARTSRAAASAPEAAVSGTVVTGPDREGA
ncbi:AMP-binding protein [Streptomyces sp. 8N706]|uniref:AMP-binding protein n=1 Tax=Streptomyces sp. 8N706 TaxID=3457416 RepID=UPI003FCFC814